MPEMPAKVMRAAADQLEALEVVDLTHLRRTVLGDALTSAELRELDGDPGAVEELIAALRATADRWEATDAA
jgi:hypothetical protein